jgi:hypothetical protein
LSEREENDARGEITPVGDLSGGIGLCCLNERLSRTGGTIVPPAVDQGMVQAPPPTGEPMPVLRPPSNLGKK